MVNHFWVFCIFFIFDLQLSLTNAKTEFLEKYCLNNGNYTHKGNYQTTLNNALSSLSSNKADINYGFYNFSSGAQGPNQVNVIGLCRGDVELNACRSCLGDSGRNLRDLCPNQKEAIGWTDYCMIRYANRSILHQNETLPNFYMYNLQNATNSTEFNKVVRLLLDSLRVKAAAGGSMIKYSTGAMNSSTERIYGLVQCTPDLSQAQCNNCLSGAFNVLPECCDGRIGGRVIRPSCNFRYEIGRFYDETSLPNAPPPQAAAPPLETAPPPSQSDGQITTPASSVPTGGLPPQNQPQGGGANRNLAFFGISTLMTVVLAILIF